MSPRPGSTRHRREETRAGHLARKGAHGDARATSCRGDGHVPEGADHQRGATVATRPTTARRVAGAEGGEIEMLVHGDGGEIQRRLSTVPGVEEVAIAAGAGSGGSSGQPGQTCATTSRVVVEAGFGLRGCRSNCEPEDVFLHSPPKRRRDQRRHHRAPRRHGAVRLTEGWVVAALFVPDVRIRIRGSGSGRSAATMDGAFGVVTGFLMPILPVITRVFAEERSRGPSAAPDLRSATGRLRPGGSELYLHVLLLATTRVRGRRRYMPGHLASLDLGLIAATSSACSRRPAATAIRSSPRA